MKGKNVIVTGGSGFIGSHLVDRLIALGANVTVIDKVKPRKLNKNNAAKYRKLNIQDEKILDVFKKVKPDVTFHLAAHLLDRESVHKPIPNAQDNVIGLLNVLDGVRMFGGKKVVYISSAAVYGNQQELPVTEETIPMPETPYGITKLMGEYYLRFYHQLHDVSYTALRFGNVLGPRQDGSVESGAVSIFTSRLLAGKTCYMNNDGLTTRDYIYVSDVVEAMIASAQSTFVGVLNIGTGVQTRTQDLFNMVCDAVGAKSVAEPREEVQDLLKHSGLDATLAKEKIGWNPAYTLEEALKETVAWYREYN